MAFSKNTAREDILPITSAVIQHIYFKNTIVSSDNKPALHQEQQLSPCQPAQQALASRLQLLFPSLAASLLRLKQITSSTILSISESLSAFGI